MLRANVLVLVPAALLAASCTYWRDSERGEVDLTKDPHVDGVAVGMRKGAGAIATDAQSAGDAAEKATDVERQLELAKRKVERAQMDVEQQRRDGDTALQKAQAELALARQDLAQFQSVEKPLRTAEAQLNLQRTADAASEQQEEMQQLELMYQKDDLGDKTKEIVLVRGKRRLERARTQLELAHKRFEELETQQLAEQQTKLELAVKGKEADLQRAEFAARTGMLDKETAVLAAQIEVDKLHRELVKAKQAVEKVSSSDADRERLEKLGHVARDDSNPTKK